INKVIRDCKLEIEGHAFDIDLIPFGYGSFNVIVGMDWLSRYKAKIICYEKVVRIPLPHDEVLRVLGERPEGKARYLMSAKTEEQKLKEFATLENVGVVKSTQRTPRQGFHLTKFIVMGSTSIIHQEEGLGLGYVLMQKGKVIAYAS
nr:putative reverse transcriptase domain-containing protein [Tanacetum cinerariifolium]